MIVLRYVLEYTPGEIAAMLEVPRGTVNSRLRRGLDRLRPVIEEARRMSRRSDRELERQLRELRAPDEADAEERSLGRSTRGL